MVFRNFIKTRQSLSLEACTCETYFKEKLTKILFSIWLLKLLASWGKFCWKNYFTHAKIWRKSLFLCDLSEERMALKELEILLRFPWVWCLISFNFCFNNLILIIDKGIPTNLQRKARNVWENNTCLWWLFLIYLLQYYVKNLNCFIKNYF